MTKFIKIILDDKRASPIFLPLQTWEQIISDTSILARYVLPGEIEWNGRSFNKTKVVFSEYDEEYSKKANEIPYELYRNKLTNTVVKIQKGSLLPPNFDIDYQKI